MPGFYGAPGVPEAAGAFDNDAYFRNLKAGGSKPGEMFKGAGEQGGPFGINLEKKGLGALGTAASFLGGPAGALVGIGANLLGNQLFNASRRRQMEGLKREQLSALKGLEARQQARDFGFTQSEGGQLNEGIGNVLDDQSERGVLESSETPLMIAQVTADAHQRADAKSQDLDMTIAASKQAIAAGTSLPGAGAAFGKSLGDIGGLLTLKSGIMDGLNVESDSNESLLNKLKQQEQELEQFRSSQNAPTQAA